jgi:hypothetical protein
MAIDELSRDKGPTEKGSRDRLIGVYIGALAVILAICSMGGSNASQEATQKNIEAANVWSFFQAKNIRRHVLRVEVDELDLMLKSEAGMSEDARKSFEAKITEYKGQIQRLTTEPDKQEGLDELFTKAKALEADRNTAMKRGPYFDYGGALLQIAIVLASVAIISGGAALLFGSAILAVIGAIATFGGFTLAFPLPFVG